MSLLSSLTGIVDPVRIEGHIDAINGCALNQLIGKAVDLFSQEIPENATTKVHFHVVVNNFIKHSSSFVFQIPSGSLTDRTVVIKQALWDRKEFWQTMISSLGIKSGSTVTFYMQGMRNQPGYQKLLEVKCKNDNIDTMDEATHCSTACHVFITSAQTQAYMNRKLSKLNTLDCFPSLQ